MQSALRNTLIIAGFEKYRERFDDLGSLYHVLDGIGWKKRGSACCSWAHAAMEGAHSLVRENSISLDDIGTIRVHGFHETVRLGTKLPVTTEEAQFNLAWPVAAMVVDCEVGPAQMLEERLKDNAIIAVAKKIEVVESDKLNELHLLFKAGDSRGKFAGRVEIILKDGRIFDSGIVDAGVSFPQTGWDRRVMEEKFRHLTGFVMEKERIDMLIDMIANFEDVKEISRFVELLVIPLI